MADDPKILVFSTHNISDPGIDLAGSAHIPYSPAVRVFPLPCSSGIKPAWIVHALKSGFDGVFVAACGSDCAFLPNCTPLTSAILASAQAQLKAENLNPKRLKMAAICSVCAEHFANHMNAFQKELAKLA